MRSQQPSSRACLLTYQTAFPCSTCYVLHATQDELNRAARERTDACVFSAQVAMGQACRRGQPGDVCWSLSAKDAAHTVDKGGCSGPVKRDKCAQSEFTVTVFEALTGAVPSVSGTGLAAWAVLGLSHAPVEPRRVFQSTW